MLKKQLISIYFYKNKIQILQLNSAKNKIEKIASVNLPDGVVNNHTIQDSESLSKILIEAWDKLKIKEKTVGLVIPEFATFTKLISLPDLHNKELNEAIEWQAKDFLPTGSEDMFMDWKVVNKKNNTTFALVVAIKKDILTSYIDAVDKAGLLPIVVETPSLSLSRMIGNESEDSLIIYTLEGEGILIVTQDAGILGSSVVFNSDKSDILTTAKRIAKHFDVNLKKIFIAGDISESDLIDELTQAFGIHPSKIDLEIKGLKTEMLNEYLIPISLQHKKAVMPADPSTVNLLPAFLVERYTDKRLSVQVWGATLTLTLFIWISFLIVLASFLILSQQYNVEVAKGNETGSILQARRETLKKVNKVNTITGKVSAIKNITIDPKIVLNEIFSAGSDSIVVEGYDLDLEKGQIKLSGVSTDRNSLVQFRQNLEGNENITSVHIPITSFEVEQNLEFTMDIVYKTNDTVKNK